MEKSSGPIVINESRWPEVVDDHSHLPQHYERSNVPPEAVRQEYSNHAQIPQQYERIHVPPEAVKQEYPNQYAGPTMGNGYPPQQPQVIYASGNPPEKRFCGLTLFQLIVLVFLGISIVIGAIVGGVLGSGVLNAGRSRASGSGSSVGTDTTDSTSSLFGSDIPTRTVTQTATSTRRGSDVFTSATATGLSADYCNNGTTYTSSSSDEYLIMCAIDWPDDTIRRGTGVHDVKFLENQPTLAGCLDTCSTWPSGGDPTRVCRAVVWNYKLQCFLKNQTGRIADTFYEYDFKYIQAGVLLT